MEELGEGLKDLEEMLTLHEDQQSQLTLNLEGSHSLNHQPKSIQGLDLGPYTCVADVQLGLHVAPLTTGSGAVSDSVACHGILSPKLDCLAGPQWERMHLILLQQDVPGQDCTQEE